MEQTTKLVVVTAATYAVDNTGSVISTAENLDKLAGGSIVVLDSSGSVVTTSTTAASLNAAGNQWFEIFYNQNGSIVSSGKIYKNSHHYKKCDTAPATKAKYTINLGTFPLAPTGDISITLLVRKDALNFRKSPQRTVTIPIRTTDTETTLIAKIKTALENNDYIPVTVVRTAAGIFTIECNQFGTPLELAVNGTPVEDLWGVTVVKTTPPTFGIGNYLAFINDIKWAHSYYTAGGGYHNRIDVPFPTAPIVDGTTYTVLDIHSMQHGGMSNDAIIDNQIELWVANSAVATALNTIFSTILDTTMATYS